MSNSAGTIIDNTFYALFYADVDTGELYRHPEHGGMVGRFDYFQADSVRTDLSMISLIERFAAKEFPHRQFEWISISIENKLYPKAALESLKASNRNNIRNRVLARLTDEEKDALGLLEEVKK